VWFPGLGGLPLRPDTISSTTVSYVCGWRGQREAPSILCDLPSSYNQQEIRDKVHSPCTSLSTEPPAMTCGGAHPKATTTTIITITDNIYNKKNNNNSSNTKAIKISSCDVVNQEKATGVDKVGQNQAKRRQKRDSRLEPPAVIKIDNVEYGGGSTKNQTQSDNKCEIKVVAGPSGLKGRAPQPPIQAQEVRVYIQLKIASF
jgi:hypothetical protein